MSAERILGRAVVSGCCGGLAAAAALALVARGRGLSAAQPINATSHWREGDRAGRVRRVDGRHTATGLATHLLATVFWASLFEAWNARRPAAGRVGRAAAVSALAAAVDYGATPHRFTPGWELVLAPRDMALAYLAMAAGLALAPTGDA